MQRVRMLVILVAAFCVFACAQARAQVVYTVTGTVQTVGPSYVTLMTPSGAVVTEPLAGTTFLSNGVAVSPTAGEVVSVYPYGYGPSASFLGPGAFNNPPVRWDWNEYPGATNIFYYP
ncbi:MAG: hypothetical protein ACYCW6_23730 [Candidatus Xenobia bacterium]